MMKKVIALLFVLVFCVSLCACQPTPDKPFVESKNDGELEAAVYGNSAPEYVNGYSAPETWTEVIEGDDGITFINVDAKITVPDVTNYPVYRVESVAVSDEAANEFIQAMIGDAELYSVSDTRTKAVIMQEIENNLSMYEASDELLNQMLKDGEISLDEYANLSDYDKSAIAELQAEYKRAPDDVSTHPVERKMKYISGNDDLNVLEPARWQVVGVANIRDDGTAEFINIASEPSGPYGRRQGMHYSSSVKLVDFSGLDYYGYGNPGMCTGKDTIENQEAMERARETADKIVFEQLGYDNMRLSRATSWKTNATPAWDWVTEPDWYEAYLFYYTPVIDGIPMLSYAIDHVILHGADFAIFNSFINPHYIEVFIDQKRNRTSVDVVSSLVLKEKLNQNVALLSFDEIQDIFRRLIIMSADYSDKHTHEDGDLLKTTLNITDIELGYIRIPEKNNTNYGVVVPVWNFYGKQVSKFRDGIWWQSVPGDLDENNEAVIDDAAGNAFLCINAIDGSIINLDFGY